MKRSIVFAATLMCCAPVLAAQRASQASAATVAHGSGHPAGHASRHTGGRGAPAVSQLAPADSAELRAFKAEIRKLYDLKEKDFAEGRDDNILNRFYSADAVSAGEGEGFSVGREDFRKIYDAVTKQATVKVRSVYTYVNGNAGWDWANFHVTPRDAKEAPFSFAILFLWAKENGQWICKGDAYVKGAFPEPAAIAGAR